MKKHSGRFGITKGYLKQAICFPSNSIVVTQGGPGNTTTKLYEGHFWRPRKVSKSHKRSFPYEKWHRHLTSSMEEIQKRIYIDRGESDCNERLAIQLTIS